MWIIDGELLFIWFLFVLMLHFRGCISTHSFSSFFWLFDIVFFALFFFSFGYNECWKKRAKTLKDEHLQLIKKRKKSITVLDNTTVKCYFFVSPPSNKVSSHEMNFTQRGKVNNNKFHFQFEMQNHAQIIKCSRLRIFQWMKYFLFIELKCAKINFNVH